MNPMAQAMSCPENRVAAPHAWRSEKIRSEHLDRLAIVYVRQSTHQQVLLHQESTRLQYGLRQRAIDLGWAAERVVVIDEDLGKSGASAEGRAGFQRLVSEVTLGNVGIILGVEMSRLARCCKDWHQLLEACGLFGCLIADLDGIYEPSSYNDRLLLGLKGTMSEAELHVLRQRLHQGKLTKARRGALGFSPPMGYVRRPSGEIQLDPDEQVQAVVRMVFRVFEERRTVCGTLRYLLDHRVQLGVRARTGPAKGEIQWRRPQRTTLYNMLCSPVYAGVYAYGRRRMDPRRKRAGQPWAGITTAPREEWYALIPDHHPAYITWDRYEANLAQLRSNRSVAEQVGSPRTGAALLGGLLVCGRCGRRLSVNYKASDCYVYVCAAATGMYGEPLCQSLAGRDLDRFVEARCLEALAPASLDLALEAAGHVAEERERLEHLWCQRLERAQYEAERAARQYRCVEPENRLVARQIEAEWEARLSERRKLEEEHRRFQREHPCGLTDLEREAIRRLSADIPTIWNAPTTQPSERKEVLRQILARIVIDVEGASEKVRVEIHWAGGSQSTHTTTRSVASFAQLSYFGELCARVRTLHAQGLQMRVIARHLDQEGFRPPKRSGRFGCASVQNLLRLLRLSGRRPRAGAILLEHEWLLADLAHEIPTPLATLRGWLHRGLVRSRRTQEKAPRDVVWADSCEVERLRAIRGQPIAWARRRRWLREEPPAADS